MDLYFRQKIDNSHLVRVPDPRRRRETHVQIAAIALLFLLLFGWAWMKYEMVWLGYQSEAVAQRQTQLTQWNRGLELQQAALRNPGRIYSLAEAHLGMQSALPGQILALDVTTPPSGSAAPAISAMLHR